MSKLVYDWLFCVFVFGVALLAPSCGGRPTDGVSDPLNAQSPESSTTDYKVFASLPRATTAAELPLLIGAQGEDFTPCLKTQNGITPQDVGADVVRAIADNATAVNQSIRAWFVEALSPAGLTGELAAGWQIRVDEPKIIELDADRIRFAEKQQCVESETGFFPKNLRVADVLIGGQKFHFTATSPIPVDVQEEMKQAVASEKMVLQSEAFFDYEAALDDAGKPISNQKGESLFKAPGGKLVPEKEVPPPEKRTMKEWTLSSDKPLYFAYRELRGDAWRRESDKDVCDLNLVWNDLTPRVPECEEFQESSFVATKTKKGEVALTITTDGKNKGVTIPFGKTEMLQVNDRILLWLSPVAIVEGVVIRLNSFVLAPKAAFTRGDKSMDENIPLRRQETPVKEEQKQDNSSKKKRKKATKKKSKAADQSIDDYLRK